MIGCFFCFQMTFLTTFLRSATFSRISPVIFNASRRCLASKTEATATEIGPSAPELQLNHLEGDLQSDYRLFASIQIRMDHLDVVEIALNRPERRNALGKQLLEQVRDRACTKTL